MAPSIWRCVGCDRGRSEEAGRVDEATTIPFDQLGLESCIACAADRRVRCGNPEAGRAAAEWLSRFAARGVEVLPFLPRSDLSGIRRGAVDLLAARFARPAWAE